MFMVLWIIKHSEMLTKQARDYFFRLNLFVSSISFVFIILYTGNASILPASKLRHEIDIPASLTNCYILLKRHPLLSVGWLSVFIKFKISLLLPRQIEKYISVSAYPEDQSAISIQILLLDDCTDANIVLPNGIVLQRF